MSEPLLNLTEVKQLLVMNDDEVMKLVREGKLNAFKIGGTYLRFDREQVFTLKTRMEISRAESGKHSLMSRVQDFLKFYGVYIVSIAVISAVLYYLLVKG